MNDKNLVPMSQKSKKEAREAGSKGGKKSGETRRKQADLRKMAQTILSGKYDFEGRRLTGEEIMLQTIVTAISDPKNKNWGKAIDTLITLTSAAKSPEELDKIRAETDVLRAKAKLLSGEDETGLRKLDEILTGLKNHAFADEETE